MAGAAYFGLARSRGLPLFSAQVPNGTAAHTALACFARCPPRGSFVSKRSRCGCGGVQNILLQPSCVMSAEMKAGSRDEKVPADRKKTKANKASDKESWPQLRHLPQAIKFLAFGPSAEEANNL